MGQHFKRMLAGAVMAAMATAAHAQSVTIKVLSSDPGRISGGDALVEVTAPPSAKTAVVTLDGKDISSVFQPSGIPGRFLGLVTGLGGANTLAAKVGGDSRTLAVKNHPFTGPIFAGPKETQFFCETAAFKMADGSKLPAATDADCSIPTVVTYIYKAKGAKDFQALPDRTRLPADIAQVTTSLGQTAPYVVRLEVGTIDRGIYQIAVLHDPTREKPVSALNTPKAWNKRLVYVFGGGCQGMYRQGATTGAILDDQFLAQGFLAVSNSLNVFANNCDDLLASEAMMMTRERAIELAGPPLYTLGWGCSGGSHQVFLTGDNYPGLMDGIVPMCNSVDWSRLTQMNMDLGLVYEWFETPVGKTLSTEQKVAVAGMTLNTNASEFGRLQPKACPPMVPAAMIYDAQTNPKGLRCSMLEHQKNSFGVDPRTGRARNVLDNVGVQYGLAALDAGTISVAQFLDLNEKAGSYDEDGVHVLQRGAGDREGIAAAYRSGRVLYAGNGLRDTPIVEMRNYTDDDEKAAHLKYGTYAFMERLKQHTGTRANYVSLLESHAPGFMSVSRVGGDDLSRDTLRKMDAWLTALVQDTGAGTRLEKMIRTKPADLVDACLDRNGNRIVEEQTATGGKCNGLYPNHVPPRMVAGGPMTNDVLKCQLKPVRAEDYKAKLSAADVARLKRIFPDGVCDWSKPGVGQQAPKGTWQTF